MIMFKTLGLSALVLASMNVNAANVQLKLTDSASGIAVQATELAQPVSGLEVKLLNANSVEESYTTDEFGRALIPASYQSSKFVKVAALQEGKQVAVASVLVSTDR